jgi:hypothetical protein
MGNKHFSGTAPKPLAFILLSVCVAAAGGCSKQGSPPEARPPAGQFSGEHVPGVPDSAYQPPPPPPKVAENRNLPRADLSIPDGQYLPITSGSQLMFLYQAFSGLPPDIEKTAVEYSKDYAGTSDTFRRRDLLEALKPKFETLRQEAKSHPYIRWDQDYTHIDHYDFARKGFLIKDPMLEGGEGYMADIRGYNINFTNGEAVNFIPLADESRARELEALFQKNNFPIRFYVFVQSADDRGEHLVHAHVVKVQVLDRSGQVLLENKAAP